MLDFLIANGWVADGTGNPTYPADVAIQGERIVAVQRLEGATARRTLDARGKIVCPGFIDAHSHTDYTIHANPLAQSTIRQGVTTEVVGNCGYSNAPVTALNREVITNNLRSYAYSGAVTWGSFGEYLETVASLGVSGNLAWLVGHNTLRQAAGVRGSQASAEQMRTMEELAHEAMQSGALGLSTGLEFEPGRTASTEEVMHLARVAGQYRGMYASHIRNRDAHLQEAVEEFLAIVRAGGTRGAISHLNVRYNSGVPEGGWERAVATMESARREGVDVMADTTPFQDGTGQLAAILPPWLKAGGPAHAAELLRAPAVRARVRGDCDRYWRFIHRGEWHRVRMIPNPFFPELAGLSLPQIAKLWGKDEWECAFDILAAFGASMDSLIVVGQLMTEELLAAMASHPLFNLGVDGWSSTTDPTVNHPGAHPIQYAGMVHYLTHHVREKHTLRLEDAIRKMSSMPATHFGLHGRGLLRAGHYADVVMFDEAGLQDVSTIAQPVAYARGVEYVWVNGVLVVDGGEHTGARPGRNLLR